MEPLTLYLAQVLGLYLLIAGAVVMLRKRYFIPVVGAFIEDRMLRLIVAMIEVLGGLALVIGHSVWSSFPAAIITLFGLLLIIEGILYLILSDEMVERYISMVNRPAWYILGGLGSIVLGGYLAAAGFGLI